VTQVCDEVKKECIGIQFYYFNKNYIRIGVGGGALYILTITG